MATAEEKTAPNFSSTEVISGGAAGGRTDGAGSATGWFARKAAGSGSSSSGAKSMNTGVLIRPVDDLPNPPAMLSNKGIQVMPRAQTSHPLDPLSAAEISVVVATVRATGKTLEVRDSMRFVEVVLLEPEKAVIALADAYYFPPFQSSLLPKIKGGPVILTKLPPRRARLVVYNKRSNETSIWIIKLTEVHAATRGGHHRGKFISSEVVTDVQPPMDAMEYAECEATVKDFPVEPEETSFRVNGHFVEWQKWNF